MLLMDPKTGKAKLSTKAITIYHMFCPIGDNFIFFLKPAEMLWRMCFDRKFPWRPYGGNGNEWITHEVWTADGENIVYETALMMMGTGDSPAKVVAKKIILRRCIPRFQMVLCGSLGILVLRVLIWSTFLMVKRVTLLY